MESKLESKLESKFDLKAMIDLKANSGKQFGEQAAPRLHFEHTAVCPTNRRGVCHEEE